LDLHREIVAVDGGVLQIAAGFGDGGGDMRAQRRPVRRRARRPWRTRKRSLLIFGTGRCKCNDRDRADRCGPRPSRRAPVWRFLCASARAPCSRCLRPARASPALPRDRAHRTRRCRAEKVSSAGRRLAGDPR
jgi:hypothetical protein